MAAARVTRLTAEKADCHVGLISGTSMDGVDAALVDFDCSRVQVLAARTYPFPEEIKTTLDRLREDPDRFPLAALARLDATLGETLAQAALDIIELAGVEPRAVTSIGSHGQTLLHRPDDNPPQTLQVGDPHIIADRTGITTVADFRRADLAAGGQGAPLAPLLHQALFQVPQEDRIVANLGGIANITVLPAGGGVAGFDTGPANCYLDLWFRRHHAERFDHAGAWAATGSVHPELLGLLLEDSYIQRPPPKSTGIEYFNPTWLDQRLASFKQLEPADVQATLAEFSARSLAQAIERQSGYAARRLILCGGGVHNLDLVDRIRQQLPGMTVESSADHGMDPDQVEAVLFAWLARRRLRAKATETGPITGARKQTLLGVIFESGSLPARPFSHG
ncbi:MAG: anhydro-N-acetylmuramic acid kinase [Wenzhouxiangella sp.]|nr:MAG: anhydro-N-acetylmuramic acid kinase [Wenzhouxiangella sp.]